jgi:cyclophilin family peptidyl-prolyl cis-trans isomerase
MVTRGIWGQWVMVRTGLAGLVLGIAFIGCDRGRPVVDLDQGASPNPTSPSENTSTSEKQAVLDPRLQQTFAEATRQDPPADWRRPPDLTLTGKSTGKLYTDVMQRWDSILLTSRSGKLLLYKAVLDTELGIIEIALRPDLAPNHVRNFIALAQAHYYDGLVFERTVRAKSDEKPEIEVNLLEGGCPVGTGEVGVGSIGYWLKPEFSKEEHDVGTVGAPHGEEPDTAACRFYITLSKAPFLDGNFTVFGKVTQGLDVARRIFSLPVRNDPEFPEGDRPEKPVVIRSVTIHLADSD